MEDKVPKIFPDVAIGDRVSDKRPSLFSQRLIELKKVLPSAFQRSFAFVMCVQRNRRTLTMYNWDPLLVKMALSKVKGARSNESFRDRGKAAGYPTTMPWRLGALRSSTF